MHTEVSVTMRTMRFCICVSIKKRSGPSHEATVEGSSSPLSHSDADCDGTSSVLDRIGGFDERLPIAQDYHHWIKVVGEGFAVGYIAEPLGKSIGGGVAASWPIRAIVRGLSP